MDILDTKVLERVAEVKRPRQESNLDARKGPALKAGALPLCDGGLD